MDQSKVNLERIRACDAGWEESKHPRAENGQFTSGGGGIHPMPAGSKATIRSKEGKRLTHNAKVYQRTARKSVERYDEKHDPLIAAQAERTHQVESQGRKNQANLEYRQFREGYDPKRAGKYHHLFTKMQYRDQNRYLAEQGKLDKMKRDRRDVHENKRIAAQVRTEEAKRYTDRTKQLQALAKALHQSHPELARKAAAGKEYAGQVAAKQKEFEGMEGFGEDPKLAAQYRKDVQKRINAGRRNIDLDRPVAERFPDTYKTDKKDFLNANSDLEAHIRATKARGGK